ncbi:MAG TPA: hypothetical protein VN808_19990 [Stellaceae bacterium]|nr:hypothetical protein [Stellaceae bacterium]
MSLDVRAIKIAVDNLQAELDRLRNLLDNSIQEAELPDPRDPRNKNGKNLTDRGVDAVFRHFDAGKTRYAVSELFGISFGAADYRHAQWMRKKNGR